MVTVVTVILMVCKTPSPSSRPSRELFVALVEYHLAYDDDCAEEIRQGLEQKVDALVRHELYAKYKTAPTAEEREQARQEYLDKRGVFPDFRW